MKGIVRLSIILSICVILVKTDAGLKDEHPKEPHNSMNTISQHQKPELFSYQQITHFADKNQPEHVVYHQRYQPRTQHLQQTSAYEHQQEPMRKQNLVPQHQSTPVAMVIIAQPTYVPASMFHNGNVAHQLLNYFRGNQLPRFQYYHAGNQQQYAPASVQPQHISQPSFAQYHPQQESSQYHHSALTAQPQSSQDFQHESLPTPQALISPQYIAPQHIPHQNPVESRALPYSTEQQQLHQQHHHHHHHHQQPVQFEQQQQQQYQVSDQQPHQQNDISQLAQQAAQHFLANGGLDSGSRTAPAIITGLELFSPEQQEKIKSQLSAHFGSPLQPLNIGGASGQSSQKPASLHARQYYHDQRRKIKSEKFVPSIEVKNGEITQTSSAETGKM